jgi:hypothetical protein
MAKDEQAADNLSRFLLAEATIGFQCNLTMAPQHPVKSFGLQVPVVNMHDGGLTTSFSALMLSSASTPSNSLWAVLMLSI